MHDRGVKGLRGFKSESHRDIFISISIGPRKFLVSSIAHISAAKAASSALETPMRRQNQFNQQAQLLHQTSQNLDTQRRNPDRVMSNRT
jgi:hypothetical protein